MNADIPDFILKLRTTVPEWVLRVDSGNGPGRYRFASDAYEPFDLDSSCLLHNVVETMEGDIDKETKTGWIVYLSSLQDEETGYLIDPNMEQHIISKGSKPTPEEIRNVRRFITRNGITTMLTLGGKQRFKIRHEETFTDPDEILAYLDSLHWHNPWGAASWAGAVILNQHFNRLIEPDPVADQIVKAGCDWMMSRQDPESGAWSDGSNVALHNLVNGIFKAWMALVPLEEFRIQHPEQVIDLCIKTLREDPKLTERLDACSIFDVALVLDMALHFTGHRRNEASKLLFPVLPMFEPMVRRDGGLSYGPEESKKDHGGLALAPVKDQSDAPGTAINMMAIALICDICALRDQLNWMPITETRFGMEPLSQTVTQYH